MSIQRGDTRRLDAFIRVDEVLTDPATLTFTYRTPVGVTTTWSWPTNPQIIHDDDGSFHVDLTFAASGLYSWWWNSTDPIQHDEDEAYVEPAEPDVPSPTVYYSTPALLAAELGEGISDYDAAKVIAQAEDITDSLLGAWPIYLTTGRKIQQTAVLSWQWSKLQRFVTKLAARLYRDPRFASMLDGGDLWDEYQGPDFSVRGRRSGASLIGSTSITLLNASGLRRLTSVATPRIGPRSQGLYDYQVANGPDPYEDD